MEKCATQFWENKLVVYGNWMLGIIDFLKSVHLIDTTANQKLYNDVTGLASLFSIQHNYKSVSEDIMALLGEFPTKESILHAIERCELVSNSLLQMYELVYDAMHNETFYVTRSSFVGMDKERAQDLYMRRHEIMKAFHAELNNMKNTYGMSICKPKNQLSADVIE